MCQLSSSAATRTRQTLQPWLNQHLQTQVNICKSLYSATLGEMLALIDEAPNSKLVLVVAHNPGLEYLLRYLQNPSNAPWRYCLATPVRA
ncbi:MAG: hypothetical protein L3J24_10120 [Xanthomonadales bacterium]|nr:hypothetical protein [Xanthomonadales bacterium]